jgi:type IX secretion system PorP/SprF family membrane protein
MKKLILISALCSFFANGTTLAQDIPLFTQKLTNSFLYNPSVAGNTFGSGTLSYRKLWSAVGDAPTTSFASLHTPFAQHRFGIGVNFYQDQIKFNNNVYVSGAFAHHIKITDTRALSLGVSAEYNNQRLDFDEADVIDTDDPRLMGGDSKSHVDFSFGTSYKTKYMILGGSANRLSSLVGTDDSTTTFPAFYSGSLQFMLPLAGDRDLLEPIVTYRSNVQGRPQVDAGLYYTYNDFATLGGSYRTGGAVNLTLGLKVNKRILIGISRDMIVGDISKGVGASYEITLRFDFRDERFYLKPKNARAINTSALAVRRKTLNTYNVGTNHAKQSARYKGKVRSKSFMSPNYRISSSKKLMTIKVKRHSNHSYRRRR